MPTPINKSKQPTSVRYEVWVNGKSTGQFLVSANDRFNSLANDTEAGEFDKVELALSDLLIADDHTLRIGDSTVKFLPREGKIECTIAEHERHYKVVIVRNLEKSHQLSDETWKNIHSAISQSKVRFLLNGTPIQQGESLPASKALVKSISIEGEVGEGITLSVSSVTYAPGKRMIISYTANRSVPFYNPDAALQGTPIFAPKTADEQSPSKASSKKQKFTTIITACIVGLTCLIAGWITQSIVSNERMDILNAKIDVLKSEKFSLQDTIATLKEQNSKLSVKSKSKKSEDSQPNSALLVEIESRPDFQEFMALVNDRDLAACQEHAIFKLLKREPNLRIYTYKIEAFCRPERLERFESKDKVLSSEQKELIKRWRRQADAKNLEDVRHQVDKLDKDLRRLK